MKNGKKIVEYKSDSKKENGKEEYSIDANGNIIRGAKEYTKKSATGRRVGAVALWLLGIGCEVLAILELLKKVTLPKFDLTTWLIILIVADLIFVVCGSLLWKKANHIDPRSEKNKVGFWTWNNLGTIVSVLAFLPLIILVLLNKDLDKKSKGIVSVVAAIALAVAGLASYDWNPVSIESLQHAKEEIIANGDYETNDNGEIVVYWLPHSTKYHLHSTCTHLNRAGTSSEITKGTLEQAYAEGLTEPCRTEIKALEKDTSQETEE
jgi:phosphatidylglycerophosphate synthase